MRKAYGKYCAAINCHNCQGRNKEKSFFSFPRDIGRCKKWVLACRRTDFENKSIDNLSKTHVLCSDHFETVMFLNDLKNRLHSNAVPSLFDKPNPPPTSQSKRKGAKRTKRNVDADTTQVAMVPSLLKREETAGESPNTPSARVIQSHKKMKGEMIMEIDTEKDVIPTIPEILCLKQCHPPDERYKVWSLKDIPMGVRFGPYQETFNIDKEDMKEVHQEEVQEIHKGISVFKKRSESGSSWLPFVNYAQHEEEANLITFHTELGMYYITCRLIPANTELLIYDRDFDAEEMIVYCAKQSSTDEALTVDQSYSFFPFSHFSLDN